MINFEEVVREMLAADTSDFFERDPGTFFASHMGFCLRQLYLKKLGLTENSELRGQFKVAQLIQDYLEGQLGDHDSQLETKVSLQIEENPVRFIGRCNLYSPDEGVVYSLKVRNGWYNFSPPVDRHIDQLHIYMRGAGVDRGKLVYFSKNDIADIQEWPTSNGQPPYVEFDPERYKRLVAKANRIRDAVWTDGIATEPQEIPFEKCGCYFCQEESLLFPAEPVSKMADASWDERKGISSTEHGAAAKTTTSAVQQQYEGADGNESNPSIEGASRQLQSDMVHVPRDLRALDVWVVWDEQSKVALAPWQEDTMYPCEWAQSKAVDPRRPYEKAKMVAELPVEEVHRTWPFPDADNLPKHVTPAVLLPHVPPDPPLTFVDFDDVRNPETGKVPMEVVQLIEALDSYVEMSRSGTGLHAYVRGHLPEEMGAFSAPLREQGSIEMYDHSRFTGGTWRHVVGTPLDKIPHAQSVIGTIIDRYGSTVPTPMDSMT